MVFYSKAFFFLSPNKEKFGELHLYSGRFMLCRIKEYQINDTFNCNLP